MNDAPNEDQIVRMFRGLFLPDRPDLIRAACRSIIDQQTDDALRGRAERLLGPASRGEEVLTGISLGTNFCPDMALVRQGTTTSEVVAIFEWKVGARFQVTGADTYGLVEELTDDVARSIQADYAVDPARTAGGADGASQLDAYRGWAWWKRAGLITISDPKDVLWVFADLAERTPAEAFPGLVSASEWAVLSAPRLLVDLYRTRLFFDKHDEQSDAIGLLGWGLWSRAQLTTGTVRQSSLSAPTPEAWVRALDAGGQHRDFELTIAEIERLRAIIAEERSVFDVLVAREQAFRTAWDASGRPQEGPIWDELNSLAAVLNQTVTWLLAAMASLEFGRRFARIWVPSGVIALNIDGLESNFEGAGLSADEWRKRGLGTPDYEGDYSTVLVEWGRNLEWDGAHGDGTSVTSPLEITFRPSEDAEYDRLVEAAHERSAAERARRRPLTAARTVQPPRPPV